MNENLLTINDLCNILGICHTTAYKLIKNREIPSCKIGKKILIRATDVENYVNQKLL